MNFYLESYQHFYQRAIKTAIKCGFTDPLETTKHDLTDVTQPSWLETITLHDVHHTFLTQNLSNQKSIPR